MKQRIRSMSRWFWLAALSLLLGGLFAVSGEAAVTNYSLNLKTVAISDLLSNTTGKVSWTSGNLETVGDVHYYEFSIEKAGFVMISYQGWSIDDSYMQVYSSDLATRFSSNSVWDCTEANPKTTSVTLTLEAGDYYIKVFGDGSNDIGTYRLGGLYAAAGNTETEPNDGFSTAMTLKEGSANRVTGFLSATDRMDFYKIVLKSAEKVKFTFTEMSDDLYFQLWNADYQKTYSSTVWDATESVPKTLEYEADLTAGVWYIKIGPDSDNDVGRYYLSWEEVSTDVSVESISISGTRTLKVGTSTVLQASVLPVNATNQTVSWKSADKTIAKVSSSGKVTGVRPGKTTITATAKDGSGVKKKITVIVKPKKMAKPTLKSTAKKTLRVTWTKQSGVSGYQIQYGLKSTFKNAKKKTVKSSLKTVTLKNLKSGKKYYVRIRSYKIIGDTVYYGAWSSVKSIKVK